ncbi:hypothetical protein Athai_34060 [Actinocatenispora thailandica]|uniref:Uncharacterized protein n=1 Tax=Actinocatenispora thailandica TaxID=227318 RepID=A0A7R7HYC0_9ACTN|nr:hypothetical protein [Actinocatenispora thailandica]BCJ35903.1 hypothetical protein Athai_34060 [Actinocatenispora thailandica]
MRQRVEAPAPSGDSPARDRRPRPVCAPEVPEPVRRRLLAGGTDPATVLLTTIVAVLFGIGGLAILLSGARPSGASPVFGVVAGDGGLLVALAAGLVAVRGAVSQRRERAAEVAGVLLGRRRLAALAAADPPATTLLAAAQQAIDAIRAGSDILDEPSLRRIEWAVATAAGDCGADPARHAALADEVRRLERWGATGPAPSGTGPSLAALSDELDRAGLAVTELRRLTGTERERTD